LRGGGGEIAARAVARHGEPRGVDVEALGLLREVLEGAVAILERARERHLRGQSIRHRDHRATRIVGELPAQVVVDVDVADNESATVEVDDQRQLARRGRAVEPRADRALRARYREVPRRMDGGGEHRQRILLHHRAQHRGGEMFDGQQPCPRRLEEGLDLRID